jgi:hypothetical protein
MAYAHTNSKGQTYYLHEKLVTLRGNNRQQRIFFFSREQKDGALEAIPSGYQVIETASSGLPVLKKQA